MIKGKCKICGREDLFLGSKGRCASCNNLDNDDDKAREYRKAHPVRAFRKSKEKKEKKDPKALDATMVSISTAERKSKISVTFDVDLNLQVSNVRVSGNWPDASEKDRKAAE